MNKIKLLSLAALCLGFVACDEVEESLSQPQTWPQDKIFEDNMLQVTTPDASYNLQSLNKAGEVAKVSTYTVTDFPTNLYELQLVMELSADEAFTKSYQVATTCDENGEVTVTPDALQSVVYQVTKNPVQQTMYVRYIANAVHDKEVVRIGGPDKFYGAAKLDITPYDPAKVIEPEYYLVGTASDGTISAGIKMDHSDINQYDDPVFTVTYNITADQAGEGFEWYVVPASTFLAGKLSGDNTAFGPTNDFDSAPEGKLTGTFTEGRPNMGLLFEEGPHLFEFNMESMTYEISLAVQQLYAYYSNPTAGNILQTYNYVDYSGYFGARQAHFTLSDQNVAAPSMRWGAGEAEGTIALSDAPTAVELPAKGLYWLEVNLLNLTYKATLCELGVVGTINNWGQDQPDVKLTASDKAYLVWKGEVTVKTGDQIKIRANEDWGINLGAPYGLDHMTDGTITLTPNSENIIWDMEGGTYAVTVDLKQVPYTMSVVKK